MVDLTIGATLVKGIRTKDILLDFANFGNLDMSHRLMLPKSL